MRKSGSRRARLHRRPDLVEVGGWRSPVDEGDAIEKEAGGEGAEEKVLHRGLAGLDLGAKEARQHVQGERHRLEAQEHHDQIVGPGHDDHARGREEHEDVKLARLHAATLQIVDGLEEHETGGVADDEGGEEGEVVRAPPCPGIP